MALVINSTTGVIDVSASTAGTYVVTYTIGQDSATATVKINSTPIATITGATSYCAGTGGTTLIANGSQSGDTISWFKNSAGTGQSTATITGQLAGTYSVRILRPASGEIGCLDISSDHVVVEQPSQNTNFAYQSSTYAQDGTNPTPVILGDSGGTFTASPSGLSINSSTGQINLSASSINSYTVTYSLPAPCPSTTSVSLGITAPAYSNVYSALFDGVNDYGQLSGNTLIAGDSAASISVWFYPTTATATVAGMHPIVHSWNTATNTQQSFLLRYWNGQFQSYWRNSVGGVDLAHFTTALVVNSWYHLVMTFSSVEAKLYVNGTLRTTDTSTGGTIKNTSYPTYYGGNYQSTRHAQGYIDEVGEWSGTALTQSQVTSIYNSGVTGDLASFSPTNWFRFGDNNSGTGTGVTNEGSGTQTVTLYNGASFQEVVPSDFNIRATAFDGVNDYVQTQFKFNQAGSASGINKFAITLWAKRVINQTTYRVIFDNSSTAGSQRCLIRQEPNGSIICFVATSEGSTSCTLANSSAMNAWCHISFIWTGTQIEARLNNGTAITSSFSREEVGLSINTGAVIGRRGYEASFSYNGSIDEVAVWDGVDLTTTNLTYIYNSGTPRDISSLSPSGYWRMGDGSTSPTIFDLGSGNNNGTMTNMTESDITSDRP